jgi:hypothetical protein
MTSLVLLYVVCVAKAVESSAWTGGRPPGKAMNLIQTINPTKIVKNFTNYSCPSGFWPLNIRGSSSNPVLAGHKCMIVELWIPFFVEIKTMDGWLFSARISFLLGVSGLSLTTVSHGISAG